MYVYQFYTMLGIACSSHAHHVSTFTLPIFQRNAKDREQEVGKFEEKFPNRFTLLLQEFKLKLQANVAEDTGSEVIDNVSLSL